MQKITATTLSIILAASVLGGFISAPAAQAGILEHRVAQRYRRPYNYHPTVKAIPAPASLTITQSALTPSSINIASGSNGAVIGAFDFKVEGEAINVSKITINVDRKGTGSARDLKNITIVKPDGTILAGPSGAYNISAVNKDGRVTLSDTISLPIGTTQMIVKANLSNNWAANDTIAVGLNTPATQVATASGNTITISPNTIVWDNTMTVKTGALTISALPVPIAQPVIAGVTNFTFANFVFDASQSAEDIRVLSITLNQQGTKATDVSNIALFDGITQLNTGANVLYPATLGAQTMPLNNSLVIPKGTIKIIALKGNISGTASNGGYQQWGITSAYATGVSTANFVQSKTTSITNGQQMTIINHGTLYVTLDSSTPINQQITTAGASDVAVTRLKLTALNEGVIMKTLALKYDGADFRDIIEYTIWDGQQKIGSGIFNPWTKTSTFYFANQLLIPQNGQKIITIKVNLSPFAQNGNKIMINYWGNNWQETYGIGLSSGASIFSDSTTDTTAYPSTININNR